MKMLKRICRHLCAHPAVKCVPDRNWRRSDFIADFHLSPEFDILILAYNSVLCAPASQYGPCPGRVRKEDHREKEEREDKKEAKDRGRVRAPKLRHFNLPVARGKEILIDSSFPRGIPHGTRVVEDGEERLRNRRYMVYAHVCATWRLMQWFSSKSILSVSFLFFFVFFYTTVPCPYMFPSLCSSLLSRAALILPRITNITCCYICQFVCMPHFASNSLERVSPTTAK